MKTLKKFEQTLVSKTARMITTLFMVFCMIEIGCSMVLFGESIEYHTNWIYRVLLKAPAVTMDTLYLDDMKRFMILFVVALAIYVIQYTCKNDEEVEIIKEEDVTVE